MKYPATRPVHLLLALLAGPLLLLNASAALTHRWSFSEASGTNVLDSVGTANGSVMVIGTNTDFVRGAGFLRMSGGVRAQVDYVQFPSSLVSSLTNVTVEVWATPRAGQTWSRIFDFGPGSGTIANDFYLSFCRGSTSLNQQRMEFDPAPVWRVDTAISTTVSNQYHYVVSWNATGGPSGGGLAQWYRDGVLYGSIDTGASSVSDVNDTVLWLGRSQFTGDSSASADYNEFRIYNHAMSSNEVNFSRSNGPDTYVAPPTAASSLTINTNPNVLTLTWTPGAGSAGSVVVMRAGQPTSMQPNYGNTYTGNASFGSGANLGSSNYVVFSGAGSTVTVTNLTPGARYYATVYSYAGSGAATVYNLADAPSVNQIAPGAVQSISLQVSSQIVIEGTAQATVLATYVGGSVIDVTSSATYSSSAPSVITVSTNGSLQALTYGSAWITASYQGKSSSNSVTVVNPLINNLKHRYTFAIDASDVAGTAHGTLQGGALIATNNVIFNGTSAYVDLPNNLVTGYTSITLETWVTDNGSGTWGRIFDFGNNNAGEDLQGTGTQYLFLALPGGPGNLRGAITLNGNAGEQLLEWAGNRPAVGQKSHIVWTADAVSHVGRLYVNGVQVAVNANMTVTPADMGPTVNNWLGKSVWPDPYFNGAMDEFRIYDVALPASLVLTNYQNGPDGLAIAAPTTTADAATLNPGAKVLLNVLANDTGSISPSTVQIVAPPGSGTAVVKSDGKILYTHNNSATSFDAFSYRVQNFLGSNSAPATVSLTISTALRLAAPTLTMPPAAPPTVLQVVDALPGATFNQPLCLATIPGNTQRLFVCERMAKVQLVPDVTAAQPTKQLFLDIQQVVSGHTPVETIEGGGNQEHGLLGLAFHPGYATNGYFYVAYTVRISGGSYYQRISRFKVSTGDPNVADPNSELILLQQLDEGSNHDGGDLHFGPDGYLYYAAGDEENPNDVRLNSQLINKDFFSGIFRIDVDKRPGNLAPNPHASIPTDAGNARFSVPSDNPFVYTSLGGTWNGTYNGLTNVSSGSDPNLATIRTEFWATGLRHVWRMSFDSVTGDLWAGDVGQDTYEEIDLIVKGGNYGWVYREGAHNTGLRNPVPAGFTSIDPVYEHLHTGIAGGDPQFKGNSVCGGVVYRGTRFPSLYGNYIWCDSVSGHIWGRNPNTQVVTRLTGVPGAYGGLVAMGVDPSNQDVLFCDYINGRILRLAAGSVDDGFPQKLSDTGAFADLTDLAPNPGLVNYSPIVPFWSDNALKSRWFSIPNLTATVTPVTDGNWTLPSGMVWVKHFDLELERGNPATKKRLETRFIVKTTNSIYGVSYAWNAAGTEAFLVPDGGTNFNLTITNGLTTSTQQWAIPSRNQCLSCHTAVGGYALSYNTRQLNQSAPLNGQTGNQLSLLSAAGYFSTPVLAPQTLPAFSRATDTGVSLEHRVRSFLAVNCVQCHQSGGGAPATWDARAWFSLEGTALINGVPNNNGGNPANKLIIPGDLAHSIVLQRLRANGFSRMPPLATSVIDEGATNLLHTWISTELTNRQTFAQWQLAIFGSTNAPNALATADPDGDGANNYYEYVTHTSPTNAVPAPWTIAIDKAAGTVSVNFQRIANLGFIVETSTNFATWNVWDVPGNTPKFSASSFVDTVSGPLVGGETNRFFRVKLVEP